jgi:hypothetical protein
MEQGHERGSLRPRLIVTPMPSNAPEASSELHIE